MNNLTYRSVTDAAELDELKTLSASFDGHEFAYSPADIEQFKAKLKQPHAFLVLVRDADNKLIGFISAAETLFPKFIFLNETLIDPAYQGQDIGKTLLTQLIDFARAEGLNGVYTETEEWNIPAQKFYENSGFVKVDNANWSGGPTYKYEFKKDKNINQILVLALFVIIGIIIGLLIGSYNDPEWTDLTDSMVEDSTPKEQSESGIILLSRDEKTFINDFIGYSFNFPPDWTTLRDTAGYYPGSVAIAPLTAIDSYESLSRIDDVQELGDLPGVSIEATGTSGGDLMAFYRGYQENFKPEEAVEFETDEGLKGLLYDGSSPNYKRRTILFPRPNDEGTIVITSVYMGDSLDEESVLVMDQVARSLSFKERW